VYITLICCPRTSRSCWGSCVILHARVLSLRIYFTCFTSVSYILSVSWCSAHMLTYPLKHYTFLGSCAFKSGSCVFQRHVW
jgi:hypothetical protein